MPLTNYTFDQLIDFTRTSSGTFVGSNGLIQTTPQSRNLLLWTQEFDNAAWVKSNVNPTANSTVAPDGTSTADTLTASASVSVALNQSSVVTSTAVTFSIYAKQGSSATTANAFRVRNTTTATNILDVTLNYATGVITYATGSTGVTATNVGNGWWRIVMTATSGITSGNTIRVDAGFMGTATSGDFCFLWGAQLEQASTASDYTRNVGGLFPARFDYDPVTLAPRGILTEEQRTNLLTYSAQFDDAAWTKQNGLTVAANTTVAPDGATTADTITNGTGQNSSGIYQTPTLTNAVVYTISYYVRAGTTSTAVLGAFAGSFLSATARVISGPGSVSGTAIITLSGLSPTEWTRVSYTVTGTGVVTSPYLYPETIGVATGKSVIVWGAQVEAGAFATSYIPTVASQVTRTADQASIVAPMFAPWFNASAGTFVAEFSALTAANTASANIASLYASGTNLNRIWMWSGAPGVVRNSVLSAGTTSAELTGVTITANTTVKAAAAYSADSFAFSTNGGAPATDNTGAVPVGVSLLGIGQLGINTEYLNGHIRRITYYPVRLSDLQLQALTS
jgi:hypothetical protein